MAFLGASPRSHRSTPLQIFRQVQFANAIDFAELDAWSGVAERSKGRGGSGMPHVLRRGRLCTKIGKFLYSFMHNNFRQALYSKKSIKNWRDKNGSKTNSKKEKVVC